MATHDYRIVTLIWDLLAGWHISYYLWHDQIVCFGHWNISRIERYCLHIEPLRVSGESPCSSSSTTSNVPGRSYFISLSPEIRMTRHRATAEPWSHSTNKKETSVVPSHWDGESFVSQHNLPHTGQNTSPAISPSPLLPHIKKKKRQIILTKEFRKLFFSPPAFLYTPTATGNKLGFFIVCSFSHQLALLRKMLVFMSWIEYI